jgi:hydroxypyruvate reductase
MAAAVEEAWGDRIDDGVVAVKDGYTVPTSLCACSKRGILCPTSAGGRRRGRFTPSPNPRAADDVVLVLVSGGGSALTPAPVPPITLGDKQAMTRLLLACGRDHQPAQRDTEALLAAQGRPARSGRPPARVEALLLSDVVGDPLDVIASGPTTPDASTFAEALDILDRFGLRERAPAVHRPEARGGGPRGRCPRRPSRVTRSSRG